MNELERLLRELNAEILDNDSAIAFAREKFSDRTPILQGRRMGLLWARDRILSIKSSLSPGVSPGG